LKNKHSQEAGSLMQLWHFVLHLRWHYQLFILSGGFLLGGFLSPDLQPTSFTIQFFNVHLLLFGGATAYNSYWDKDEGPIGGLQNPPPMTQWMWPGALLLQLVGLMLAIPQGSIYMSFFVLSMLFFWLYSTPLARWKSRPIKSLVAIGISTGFNSVLLGYVAAGSVSPGPVIWIAALGVLFMLLSLYPLSQIYQKEEDLGRGDQTFALQYGPLAVKRFFTIAFFLGLVLVSIPMVTVHARLAVIFGAIGIVVGVIVRIRLNSLSASQEDYTKVMGIKYATSMAFVLFLLSALILKHTPLREISSFVELLLK
jgi:4-hydroxybenzoate polyprenyltransferase